MPTIIARKPNLYSGSLIDRAADRREDTGWLAEVRAAPGTLWIPVWRGQHLIDASSRIGFVTGHGALGLRDADWPWAFLGTLADTAIFAVDLSGAGDPATIVQLEPPARQFAELRPVVAMLPSHEAALLAQARGILHWRQRHGFCGNCGAAVQPRAGGNVLYCESCGTQHFPRSDPAVIMLVSRGDRALLAHSKRFPVPTMYSTLAGFVEPGETLEEAVSREVLEEVGVRVGRVEYHSSQPWPFPASLMIGFYAEAYSDEITIDGDEIADARWFSRAEVREADRHGFVIPGQDSIARRLIDDWVDAA